MERSIYTGLLERAAESLTASSAATFATLSALRRKRFFHPSGVVLEAQVTFGSTSLDLPFEGTSSAIVRLSKGIGTPGPLPDIFGIAIRFDSPGHDLLLATSGRGRVARHVLIPARSLGSPPYSTILPYEMGDELVVFGARTAWAAGDGASVHDIAAVAEAGLSLELTVTRVGDTDGETFAHVDVGDPVEMDVRFNPWNCAPPLRPAGPLNRLRRDTYAASQEGRAATSTG